MSDTQAAYSPLSHELDGRFSDALADLPDLLRERVMAAFYLLSWDECTVEQRMSRAMDYDGEHDPGWEVYRKFWFDLVSTLDDIQLEKAGWSKVAALTATELKAQRSELQALKDREGHLQAVIARLERRDFPGYQRRQSIYEENPQVSLISLNSTEDLLMLRLGASPEEIAAWVSIGSDNGGLDAYQGGSPAERFYFKPDKGNDYLSHLYLCRFLEKQVVEFVPVERFVTGVELLANMLGDLGSGARSYVLAQISDGSLLDIHPTKGVTDAGLFSQSGFPHLEDGLFPVSQLQALSRREGWKLRLPKRLAKIKERAESPAQRKERLTEWHGNEVRQRGPRGATSRVAAREGVTRQVIEQILRR